jgi:hypothetical protein
MIWVIINVSEKVIDANMDQRGKRMETENVFLEMFTYTLN